MGSRSSSSSEYRINVTKSFSEDLDASVSYYLKVSGPRSAKHFLESYDSFVNLLEVLPGHGSLIEGTPLRWRKVGVFVVVYLVDDASHVVTLLRMYYVSSDWRTQARKLRSREPEQDG